MQIVFVIGCLERGGAETQLLMLMRGLVGSEFKPQLFVLEPQGVLRSDVEKSGIPIIDGDYDSSAPRVWKFFQLIRALWRLWRLLRNSKAGVVHGFLPLTNLLAAVAGRLAITRCVITSRRALNAHQDRVPGWHYADRLLSILSHVITANSMAVRDDTLHREGGSIDRFHIIYNGLNAHDYALATTQRDSCRAELSLKVEQVVLIIVANLIPYKGHVELLNAFAQLLPKHPELQLLVVGEDRGIGDSLFVQANRLGVAESVQWLGLRSDIARLLAAADIYVCASHEEGFSNSLLEAMAAGKPVVATRVGGNPEMLGGGEFGILVDAQDATALAEGIERLVLEPAQRVTLGEQAATQVVSCYSSQQMVKAYIKLYKNATGVRNK